MPSLNVHIKHAGKTHDVLLDTDRPPIAFKDAIYQVTGVPPERMKVMIKGGMLKVRCRENVTVAFPDISGTNRMIPSGRRWPPKRRVFLRETRSSSPISHPDNA